MNLVETMSTDEEGMEILLRDMGVVSSGKLCDVALCRLSHQL